MANGIAHKAERQSQHRHNRHIYQCQKSSPRIRAEQIVIHDSFCCYIPLYALLPVCSPVFIDIIREADQYAAEQKCEEYEVLYVMTRY